MLLGHSYFHQGFIGIAFGVFYLIVCLQLDNGIHQLVEKAAFITKKSRKHKFNILFWYIGLLTATIVFYSLDLT